jgi:hypothetical protein
MITFDPSRIDLSSVLLGAFAWWLWSKIMGTVYYWFAAIASCMKNDSREKVMGILMEKARMTFDKRLPHWTVTE